MSTRASGVLASTIFLMGVLAGGAEARPVEAGLRDAGFGDVAERAAAVARPTWLIQRRIVQRHPRGLGTSRLGGRPDLPGGRRWPRCKRRPQTFLGQVRLRDLPAGASRLRGHGGLLLFFMDVEFDLPETRYGIDGGRCVSVIHARPSARLVRHRSPPRQAALRIRPAVIRFRRRVDFPDASFDYGRLAPPLHDVVLSGSRPFDWSETRMALQTRRRDPDHRLLGYVDTPNGEHGRCWWHTRRTRRPAWQHLFSMSYDEPLGFAVGDGGSLQVVISPADLRAGRFERACGIFRQ